MNYVIVGYTTKPVPDVEKFLPGAYRDAGISVKSEADDLALTVELGRRPYTSVLDKLAIVAPGSECRRAWTSMASRPELSVAVQAGLFLVGTFPKAWLPNASRDDQVVFVGFDPARLLNLMAIEASLPRFGKPLPSRMWANAGYVDVTSAVLPPDAEHLTLPEIVAMRAPVVPEAKAKWDERLAKWTGPGVDPNLDTWLATELAAQMRLFDA